MRREPELIGEALRIADQCLEITRLMKPHRREAAGGVVHSLDNHLARIGSQDADYQVIPRLVHAEHGKGVSMMCAQKRSEVSVVKGSVVHRKALANRLTSFPCACETGFFSGLPPEHYVGAGDLLPSQKRASSKRTPYLRWIAISERYGRRAPLVISVTCCFE